MPARGWTEVALGLYYKTFLIYRTCMRRVPARPVRACFVRSCCGVVVQGHDLCAGAMQRQANTLFTLHTSHLISALLISSHLFSHVIQVNSSQLFSSHPSTDQPFSSPQSSSQLIPAVLHARELLLSDRSLLQKKTFGAESFCTQKLETQMHLHRETFTKYFVLQSLHKALLPLLLCTTKLAQGTSLYYFVLQSLHNPVLLSTTKLAQFFS